ncbi:hypothetical protein [Clostridium folliculivorans]|uniref:hypothetical protein n=1 Tax=Clostridium folliculivorans TaxID=2886038 RepID=UPI0021C4A957|nr:hypothetical protein [Clostridium folliculivorans]GKU30355.1 hypothetical protein CFB3_24620 [Clostridium folliculivorans]
MKDIAKKGKLSKIISGLSVIISLLGIIIALMNMRFLITHGKDTWEAVKTLLIGIPIFLVCTAQFIILRNKYRKHSK